MRFRPGFPPGRPWESAFSQAFVHWVAALCSQDRPGTFTWAQLAPDCEIFLGRDLLRFLHHKLRGTRLPLGDPAQVLRHMLRLLWRHPAAVQLMRGAAGEHYWALLPLRRLCARLRAQPFFEAHAVMVLQLKGLDLHEQDTWLHRLRTRAHKTGGGATTLIVAYLQHPLDTGLVLLCSMRRRVGRMPWEWAGPRSKRRRGAWADTPPPRWGPGR